MPVKDPRHWLMLLERLAELARAQRACCEQGDLEQALEILERRQTIVTLLGDRFPSGLHDDDLARLRQTLQAIMVDDRVSEEILQRRRLEVLETLARYRRGARALAGYRAPRLAHALDVRE